MKGFVLLEFLSMTEDRYGPEVVEAILEEAPLPSLGTYSHKSDYDYRELLLMAKHLDGQTGEGRAELLRIFGDHLFGRLADTFPNMLEGIETLHDFLVAMEEYVASGTLYFPDDERPDFHWVFQDTGMVEWTYHSVAPLASCVEGFIQACASCLEEDYEVQEQRGNFEAERRLILRMSVGLSPDQVRTRLKSRRTSVRT